ncbi:hypothetical protein T4D_7700 [Trichinella pseudospiralis]|uniref:Uncharacterized protein n=1 Tax=Trichinella pseudospiralis TaxID=6337 RepID=A0A0V1F5B2_TRIPS|nr:hypothetical protein T4D_7700 [Trichinella pseudospiralis]
MSCYLHQLCVFYNINPILPFANQLFYKHFHEKLQDNDGIICQILSEQLSVICTSDLNSSQLTRRY